MGVLGQKISLWGVSFDFCLISPPSLLSFFFVRVV